MTNIIELCSGLMNQWDTVQHNNRIRAAEEKRLREDPDARKQALAPLFQAIKEKTDITLNALDDRTQTLTFQASTGTVVVKFIRSIYRDSTIVQADRTSKEPSHSERIVVFDPTIDAELLLYHNRVQVTQYRRVGEMVSDMVDTIQATEVDNIQIS